MSVKPSTIQIRHPFAEEPKPITIKISNENIPHLIGLSKMHHLNLPITQPAIIFQKVKLQEKNWTLPELSLLMRVDLQIVKGNWLAFYFYIK